MSGIPYMELDEVSALLGYVNARAAKRAIKAGKFELPTYQLAGRTVVSVKVAKRYFAERDDEGELEMDLKEGAA